MFCRCSLIREKKALGNRNKGGQSTRDTQEMKGCPSTTEHGGLCVAAPHTGNVTSSTVDQDIAALEVGK